MADSKDKYTVISAIAEIVKTALYEEEGRLGDTSEYYRFDEKLMREVSKPAEFLAGRWRLVRSKPYYFPLL